jgi:hypothetical protein
VLRPSWRCWEFLKDIHKYNEMHKCENFDLLESRHFNTIKPGNFGAEIKNSNSLVLLMIFKVS